MKESEIATRTFQSQPNLNQITTLLQFLNACTSFIIGGGDSRRMLPLNPYAQTSRLTINGLWGLAFGNGGLACNTNTLFFAAGFNDEADGLFGSIVPA